jgi:O-antigen ligase
VRTAAIPFARSTLQQLLVSLVAIKIAGLLVIFDAAGLQSFDLPKSLFSRSMEWLIAGALVIALLRYGRSIIPRTPLHFAIGALVAVNVLSTVFAENGYIAIFGEENRYLGLSFVVDMAILYLAVAVAFRRSEDWALFGGILAVVSALILGYATLQRFGLDPLRWDASDPVIGTLGNANTFGRFLSLIFGASFGVAALGGGQFTVRVRRGAAFLTLAILATAAFATNRGTLLGIAAAVGALPLLYIRMRGLARRDVRRAAVLVVGTAAALAVVLAFTPAGARAQSLIRDPSAQQIRVLLIDSAIRAFMDRPLVGYGPDSFAVVYPRYRQADDATFGLLGDDAHSWLFQTAGTTGALGVLALAAAIAMSTWTVWRRLRRVGAIGAAVLLASVGYWVHASVTIASVGLDWFPYLAFGAAASLVGPPATNAPPKRVAAVFATAVIVCVIAVAGGVTGVSAFLANRDAGVAAFEINARPQRSLIAAESAVSRDGQRAVYWYWLGRAHAALEEWPASSAAFRVAATLSPYERAYWAHLARSLAHEAGQSGDPTVTAAAIAAARTGTETDPNEPLTHVALAEVAYTLKQYDLSLQAAVAAISLWPRGDNDALAARAAGQATDVRQARSMLENALRYRDSPVLHLALAEVALRLQDYETARAEAKRTLELAPDDAGAEEMLRAIGR